MLSITTRIGNARHDLKIPESLEELTVEQYQKIISDWDHEDWVQLFGIISGLDVSDIKESKDGKLEGALYQCISFIVHPTLNLEDLPIPDILDLRPLWIKDCPLVIDRIKIPRKLGNLSIGQKIQARKSLEDVKDIREAISIVTAIYLQPLIDKGKFDFLRAIEIERVILKMPITKIFPIGFFLFKKLRRRGNGFTKLWRLIKSLLHINTGKIFLRS